MDRYFPLTGFLPSGLPPLTADVWKLSNPLPQPISDSGKSSGGIGGRVSDIGSVVAESNAAETDIADPRSDVGQPVS